MGFDFRYCAEQLKCADEMVTHTVGRALDLFGIDAGVVHRWKETTEPEVEV